MKPTVKDNAALWRRFSEKYRMLKNGDFKTNKLSVATRLALEEKRQAMPF